MRRASVVFFLGFLTAGLLFFTLYQPTRIVRPAELLPELTGIESAVLLLTNPAPTQTLSQARAEIDAAISQVNSHKSTASSNADLSSTLNGASKKLAIAEDDAQRQSVRVSVVANEVGVRVRQLKDQIGPPSSFDRLVGIALKELLIAFAWPLLTMITVLYLLASQRGKLHLRSFVRLFRSVKLPWVELVVGEELKQNAEQAFRHYREQVKLQFDSLAQKQSIAEIVSRILNNDIDPILCKLTKFPDYRCTIHVPDVLFADTLYQLIDYLLGGGGPRGRTWSVRYGMMGRQWRLGKSDASGRILPNVDQLITEWGMTRTEAGRAKRSQSLVCCILQPADREPVGIFYLDAAEPDAFGGVAQTQELLAAIPDAAERFGLIEALRTMRNELRKQAPLIQLDDTKPAVEIPVR